MITSFWVELDAGLFVTCPANVENLFYLESRRPANWFLMDNRPIDCALE
jgi:hypothetical protein